MITFLQKLQSSKENAMHELPGVADSAIDVVEQAQNQIENGVQADELVAEIVAFEDANEVINEMESVVAQQQANIDAAEGNPVSETVTTTEVTPEGNTEEVTVTEVPADTQPELSQDSSPEEVQNQATEYTATVENLLARLARSTDTVEVRKKLGVVSDVASSESICGGSPLRSLKITHEGAVETLKNAGRKVWEWLKSLMAKIKGMLSSVITLFNKNDRAYDAMNKNMQVITENMENFEGGYQPHKRYPKPETTISNQVFNSVVIRDWYPLANTNTLKIIDLLKELIDKLSDDTGREKIEEVMESLEKTKLEGELVPLAIHIEAETKGYTKFVLEVHGGMVVHYLPLDEDGFIELNETNNISLQSGTIIPSTTGEFKIYKVPNPQWYVDLFNNLYNENKRTKETLKKLQNFSDYFQKIINSKNFEKVINEGNDRVKAIKSISTLLLRLVSARTNAVNANVKIANDVVKLLSNQFGDSPKDNND